MVERNLEKSVKIPVSQSLCTAQQKSVYQAFDCFCFSFFLKFILNWRIIVLQYCVGFCHMSTWTSHSYMSPPSWTSSHLLLHPTPIGCHRALGLSSLHHAAAAAKSLQLCPTLWDPTDGSPPGSLSLGFSRQEHWSGLPFPSPMHENEVKVKSLSHIRLLATPWTSAHQAPPSMGFSRQEYWSGMPLPSLPCIIHHSKFPMATYWHMEIYMSLNSSLPRLTPTVSTSPFTISVSPLLPWK